jgi:putative addiction module CopG family antidote
MNVNLSDDLFDFVGQQTREGGYTNQSEVVREGLRLMRARAAKRRALLDALEVGHAAVEAGDVEPLTDALLRDIGARGRARAEARSRASR